MTGGAESMESMQGMERAGRRGAILTIGHSTHEAGQFVALLRQHRVEAVADVRSMPYSRWRPHFNRERLSEELQRHGVAYVFLGRELGARSEDPACYGDDGRVRYRKLAGTEPFRSGLRRVLDGSRKMRVALMCAEKEPLDCHRTILVARELVRLGRDVDHILADGALEPHPAAMQRLRERLGLPQRDLLRTPEELDDEAYAAQERKIAYVSSEERARARRA